MKQARVRYIGSAGKVSRRKFISLLLVLGLIAFFTMSMFWLNVPKNYDGLKGVKKSLLDSDRQNYIPNAVEQKVGDINAPRRRTLKTNHPNYGDDDRRYLEGVLKRK